MPSSLSTTTRLPLQSTTTLGKPFDEATAMNAQSELGGASRGLVGDARSSAARLLAFSPPCVCFLASLYFLLLHGFCEHKMLNGLSRLFLFPLLAGYVAIGPLVLNLSIHVLAACWLLI
jgi:hypothetical protein